MRQKQIEGNSIVEVAADRQADLASKADSEKDTASCKSGPDDGGDSFVTVERSRKSREQKRCDKDKERQNPLEVMGSATRSDSRVRSRSRNATKVSESNAAIEMC